MTCFCWTAVAQSVQARGLWRGWLIFLPSDGRFFLTGIKRRKWRQPYRNGCEACVAADQLHAVLSRPPQQQTHQVQARYNQTNTDLARPARRAHVCALKVLDKVRQACAKCSGTDGTGESQAVAEGVVD